MRTTKLEEKSNSEKKLLVKMVLYKIQYEIVVKPLRAATLRVPKSLTLKVTAPNLEIGGANLSTKAKEIT